MHRTSRSFDTSDNFILASTFDVHFLLKGYHHQNLGLGKRNYHFVWKGTFSVGFSRAWKPIFTFMESWKDGV
jgi:hypothetical protein